LFATLPLPDGDRVVGIRLFDRTTREVQPQATFDFTRWREQRLESIEDLGAFRITVRNFITSGRAGDPVAIAEITASAFRLARVAPLLGRPLVDADERPGAPAVVVIGHDVWQNRFGGSPNVVGRSVHLGEAAYTIVGVMPERFAFPVADGIWVPLQLGADLAPLQGPRIIMFGRLAAGVSQAEAQREMSALGLRAAADHPATHEHLLPQVVSYPRMLLPFDELFLAMTSAQVFALLLVLLICGNVALLMFARTATRESEFALRNALGAGRGRIIIQLFAEALVLGLAAAAVGLVALSFGLGMAANAMGLMDGGRPPFWLNLRPSPATLLFSTALAVLAALVAGVLPALKATRTLGTGLQRIGAGSGLHFGGMWTAVIIVQIALTVAFPVAAYVARGDATWEQRIEVGFPDHEYLIARVAFDASDAAPGQLEARLLDAHRELQRRLAAEPAIAGVTFADVLPRMYHSRRFVQVNEGGAEAWDPRWPSYPVSTATVGLNYFDVLRTPVLAGRGFQDGDLRSDPGVAIVNESFVKRVLGGRNPIGRRLRYLSATESGAVQQDAEPGPWIEIVGVVPDLGMAGDYDPKAAGIYLPAAQGSLRPLYFALHVRGNPRVFAPRLRTLAAEVSPALRVAQARTLDSLKRGDPLATAAFLLFVVLSTLALVLSLAAIYAITSFTVARRTREIGIRVALGAHPRRIVAAIFARPVAQVGAGILAGGVLVYSLLFGVLRGGVQGLVSVAGYALLMMAVCLLACIVPTRRALRVQPTVALKEE
jgi:predicted permease